MDQIDKDIGILAKDSRIESIERLDENTVKIETNDLICDSLDTYRSPGKKKVLVGKISFTIDFSKTMVGNHLPISIKNKSFNITSMWGSPIIAPMLLADDDQAFACWLSYATPLRNALIHKELLPFVESILSFICNDTGGYYTHKFPDVS